MQISWMIEKKENGKSKSMEIKNSNAHGKMQKLDQKYRKMKYGKKIENIVVPGLVVV